MKITLLILLVTGCAVGVPPAETEAAPAAASSSPDSDFNSCDPGLPGSGDCGGGGGGGVRSCSTITCYSDLECQGYQGCNDRAYCYPVPGSSFWRCFNG